MQNYEWGLLNKKKKQSREKWINPAAIRGNTLEVGLL